MAVPLLLCGVGVLFAMCAACFYRMGAADWADEKKFLIDSLESLESENAKLRELCRRYGEYISQDRCEGCVYKMRCNNGLIDECWQLGEIRNLASELGFEVDV